MENEEAFACYYHNKNILIPFYIEEREKFIFDLMSFIRFVAYAIKDDMTFFDEGKREYIETAARAYFEKGEKLLFLETTIEGGKNE